MALMGAKFNFIKRRARWRFLHTRHDRQARPGARVPMDHHENRYKLGIGSAPSGPSITEGALTLVASDGWKMCPAGHGTP